MTKVKSHRCLRDNPEMKETDISTTVKPHGRSETDLWRTKLVLMGLVVWFALGGGHWAVVVTMSLANDEKAPSRKERCGVHDQKPCNDKESWDDGAK